MAYKRRSMLQNSAKIAPTSPGCYIFRDSNREVLYIGKAVNLRSRVSSYFAKKRTLDIKTSNLVRQVNSIQFVLADSELEALILETNLIKKYTPKYNKLMKDDKNYVWLMATKAEDFPRLEFVRKQKIKQNHYFGPFMNVNPIKRILKNLRKIFPYRTCKRKIDVCDGGIVRSSNPKPCLYFYLGLCNAPCTTRVSRSQYRKNINHIKSFFRSRKFEIIKNLTLEMNKLAKSQKFERAAEIRSKLIDMSYIAQRIRVRDGMDEECWESGVSESEIDGLKNLISKLDFAKLTYKKTFRVECYDISNISGKYATGSMIVFMDGKPDKSEYRKFRIKTTEEPDDFLMMQEVFLRRFKPYKKKSDKSFKKLPDLIIVDGGKGQLSASFTILKQYKLDIPIIGLAKKNEEIFRYQGDKFKKIKLKKGSNELFLIQRIRDEAHRFAIKYHRILRSKGQIGSVLDKVPGIGEVTKKRLLKTFGSIEGIRKASAEELRAVVRNRKTMQNIRKLL